MSKCIFTTLSPNADKALRVRAFGWMFSPLRWKKGNAISRFEKKFSEYFESQAISFDSGRSALLAALTCLRIGKGDEVITPGFTCIVVPNAIVYAGAKPIYCDIDPDTYNIDADQIESLITPKTRAIILQHTFGKPCDIEKILEICKRHKIFIIEDCAHSLGSRYSGKLTGTFGDVAIFSFGRDKVISSVHGGMALTRNPELGMKLKNLQANLRYPSMLRIFQALFHPIAFGWILPLYPSKFSKGILWLLQKLRLLSKAIESGEKKAQRPLHHPARMPSALADMALSQFVRLHEMNQHRNAIAKIYHQNLRSDTISIPRLDIDQTYLLYTVRTADAHKIIHTLRDQCIELGNWTGASMLPADSRLESVYYRDGSCPVAETVSKQLINLPTHINISKEQATLICELILRH